MSDWFDKLQTAKQEMLRGNLATGDWNGIRDTIVNPYSEDGHFIYELLQNADDQEAHEVGFLLYSDYLVFEHHGGKPFERSDVEGITRIGTSVKLEQHNKIGRYGIGFKSVYAVTDCPQIYTYLDGKPFAFEISNLVVPERLTVQEDHPQEGSTRFVLPFKAGHEAETYAKLAGKLRGLGAKTIMFLNHLKLVSWDTASQSGVYICERPDTPDGICRLERELTSEDVVPEREEARYLRFSKPVPAVDDRTNLSVAIAFRLDDNGQIIEEKGETFLSVYFPTKEKTRLKFCLHAPMLLSPERANVHEDHPTNSSLIKECASLLAETLPKLRQRELLTPECLCCLPLRQQDFPVRREINGILYERGSFFRPLYEAVRYTMLSDEPLIPTDTGKHATVKQARIPESPVRTLLNQKQITRLHNQTSANPVCWTSEKIKTGVSSPTSELYSYLQELGVKPVDLEDFAKMVKANSWFMEEQSEDWLIRFYNVLLDRPFLWEKGKPDAILRRTNIIRLEDGSHVVPFDANDKPAVYFPLPNINDARFRTVNKNILQNAGAVNFLRRLGLSEPDKVDVVLDYVLPKYKPNVSHYDAGQYAKDISIIGQAVEEASHSAYASARRSDLERELKRAKFILATNQATKKSVLLQAKEVYSPTPELSAWFDGCSEAWFISDALQNLQGWKAIVAFLNDPVKTKTIADKLVIQRTQLLRDDRMEAQQPDKKGYVKLTDKKPYKRGLNGFDPGADITGLVHAVQHPTLERARLLWKMLGEHSHLLIGEVETAIDARFTLPDKDRIASKIWDACHNTAWLPDTNNIFRKPSQLGLVNLPHDFDKNTSAAKQVALDLGMKKVAPQTDIEKLAASLNIPPSALDLFTDIYKKNPEGFKQWAKDQQFANFSSGDPASERRLNKLGEYQPDAPMVERAQKLRSTRISSTKISAEDKAHLRLLYDKDGRMQCQICCGKMPFKVNGEDYFEAVQCIRPEKQELLVNRLALCPICAAKYLYANSYKATPADMARLKQAILSLEGETLPITLAGIPHKIHFKRKHLDELKKVFSTAKHQD